MIYIYFLFLMNASVSTLTMKSAKHGMCWMSHTSAKGVGHEQCGRAQRKKNSVVEHLRFFHFWVGDHT